MKQDPLWQGKDAERSDKQPDETDALWDSDLLVKILIVDDEEQTRRRLYELLESNGYECWAVGSAEEAKDLLPECRFDLLLLDLKMPAGGGEELLLQLTQFEHQPAVVVISDEAGFAPAADAGRGGAIDFLRKPYPPQDLLRALENVLEKRRLLQQNRRMQEQLSASEQLHRFIVSNSPDIIYMLDAEGRFSFVNERIESMLGYPHGELLGRHYASLIHSEDMEKAQWAFNERRTADRATRNLQLRLIRYTGPQQHLSTINEPVPIELSAMGIYRKGEDGLDRFMGTYGLVRDISERKRAEELINFQRQYDHLTRLPNRALLRDRLGLAISQARHANVLIAVMHVDLDRFKTVHDALGQLPGEALLRTVAGRLKSCLRGGDTLARVGGDEFTLMLPNVRERRDVTAIAEQVHNALSQPFDLDDRQLHITASLGIALYPLHGENPDSLLGNADIAMHEVKRRGKNGYAFYSAGMKSRSTHQLDMSHSLRQAIRQNQLKVHYQPIVRMQDHQIQGVEALVRWRSPDNGLLLPSEFLPLAEESGLLQDLNEVVLRQACRDYMQWRDQGLAPPGLAVNLPASLLCREDLVDWLSDVLNECGIPFGVLEVEVAESAVMQDMQSIVERLMRLHKSHGVKITVDDFGSGYSSLGYLEVLPVHNIKLDRSFLERIKGSNREDAIVEAVANLARKLKLDLIAEGVESREQLDYLLKLNCPLGQGYFFSKPLPFEEMTGLLRHWPRQRD